MIKSKMWNELFTPAQYQPKCTEVAKRFLYRTIKSLFKIKDKPSMEKLALATLGRTFEEFLLLEWKLNAYAIAQTGI